MAVKVGILKEVLKLLKVLQHNIDIYTTVIGVFFYHLIFEREFTCSCQPEHQQIFCLLYLLLPWVLIGFLLLWMDKGFHRAFLKCTRVTCGARRSSSGCLPKCWKRLCRLLLRKNKPVTDNVAARAEGGGQDVGNCCCPCCLCCCSFLEKACCHLTFCTSSLHFLRAFSVSSIWIVIMLLDGDWWVCCLNDGSDDQMQIACKDQKQLRPSEELIVAKLKNTSRICGLLVLAAIAFVLCFVSCSCTMCCWHNTDTADLILEKEDNVFLKSLEQLANIKTEKCFDEISRGQVQKYLNGVDMIQWDDETIPVEVQLIQGEEPQPAQGQVLHPHPQGTGQGVVFHRVDNDEPEEIDPLNRPQRVGSTGVGRK
ncbi:uncharacterized protein LOC129408137 [Boleophthalmus pectinirostris]|uniref:uncharacterized protein LOC129408137 n=1 Tax=Boleophthalmus pectinirostris TaxID=150288 RepID=UPI002432E0D9|nr:uncharacterized protein LOC129408137 [Boleophthalmus pectinirostris]